VVAPVSVDLAGERVPAGFGVAVLPHGALAPVEVDGVSVGRVPRW
jgi:hypothetical protein